MSKFIGFVIGGLAVAAGVLIEIGTFGAATPLLIAIAGALLVSGTGMVLSGLGTLISGSAQSSQAPASIGGGSGFASRNPVKSWDIVYGHCVVGGTIVYLNEFGDNNKWLDMIVVLTAHPCQSVDRLLLDKQFVQLHDNGGGTYDSFSPVQQTIDIQHITRTDGVVTVTLGADIPLLQVGDRIAVQNVTGDHTLNGTFPVSEIIRQVFVIGTPGLVVFRYICGGPNAIVDNEGQVLTKWADYGPKIHMEVLLGAQALGTTFPGTLSGTANDGDTSDLISPGLYNEPSPWTANCSLVGKTAIFLRLHFDAKVWSAGLPSISFEIHGKNDIYDPRLGGFGDPGTTGYTESAALIICDYLAQPSWGFKAQFGTEIPLPQLIAEANICDEDVPLAIGGSSTYANGTVSVALGETAVGGSGTSWTSDMNGGALIVGGYIATILSVNSPTSITLRANFVGLTASGLTYDIAYGAGIEPRYALNGTFDLSRRRGEILQNLLTACGGRLSYQGGQFLLQVAAWRGSSPAPAPGLGAMSGAFRWRAKRSITDLYNQVSGTYISPSNAWHPSDIPLYAQDSTHGYGVPWSGATSYPLGVTIVYDAIAYLSILGSTGEQPDISPTYWAPTYTDDNLAADDGDRRRLDVILPFTTSPATAQRLCKIELLRRRFQGTGTFRYNMVGYQFVPGDVISMDLPLFNWSGKLLEIGAVRFVLDKRDVDGAEVTSLGTEIDVQETDPSIYDWDTSEELSPEGYRQPQLPNPFTPAAPTDLVLISDTETAVNTPAGLADAILVKWTVPNDGYVTEGGHIEIQYQQENAYLEGTISVTNGSAGVTGSGTAWTDLMAGGAVSVEGSTYAIKSITSPAALVLNALFGGTTASGQSYALSYPGSWIGLPSVSPMVTEVVINGVVDIALYNVEIRSVNTGGFPSAWVAGSVVAHGASLPLPWKPFGERYLWSLSGYTFEALVGPSVPSGLFGSIGALLPAGIVAVLGAPPCNVLSAMDPPVVDRFARVTSQGGNTLPVGQFVLSVHGVDSDGFSTMGSDVSQFNIVTAASRVSVSVEWPVGTVAYEVFVGPNPDPLVIDLDGLVGLGRLTPGTLPATIDIDDFAGYPGVYGPPDANASKLLVRAKQVIHGGIGDSFVFTQTSSTIGIAVVSAPAANEFVGRYLIRTSKAGIGGRGLGFSVLGPITASDTGSPVCIVTVAGASHLAVNDFVMLSTLSDTNTATSIGDSGFASPASGGSTTGLAVNAEVGEVIRILYDPTGVATNATATVISNTSTVATTTQFRLFDGTPVTPGAGSVFIYEANSWVASSLTGVQAIAGVPTILTPGATRLATLDCSALEGDVALVETLLTDAWGNQSDTTADALRLLYITPVPLYFSIIPTLGHAAIDLWNGLTQRIVLTGTAVTVQMPSFTGTILMDGMTFTLLLDQDSTGGRLIPTFSGGTGGFAADVGEVQIDGTASTRTSYDFVRAGGMWCLASWPLTGGVIT